jgi:hypothetical protein
MSETRDMCGTDDDFGFFPGFKREGEINHGGTGGALYNLRICPGKRVQNETAMAPCQGLEEETCTCCL